MFIYIEDYVYEHKIPKARQGTQKSTTLSGEKLQK